MFCPVPGQAPRSALRPQEGLPPFWGRPPSLIMPFASFGTGWLARLGPWFARRPQEGVPLWSSLPRLIFPLAGTCYPMPFFPPSSGLSTLLLVLVYPPSPVLPPLFLRFEWIKVWMSILNWFWIEYWILIISIFFWPYSMVNIMVNNLNLVFLELSNLLASFSHRES